MNRYSEKFKKLNKRFKILKKQSIRGYYVKLTQKLKSSNLRNYFKVMKQICGYETKSGGADCVVEELADLSEETATERIAEHFAAVSSSYLPVQLASLPIW